MSQLQTGINVRRRGWSTRDLLLMGVLGVVFAVVIIAVNYAYMTAATLVGPIYSRVLIGFYMMPGIMALYLIRKPGAGLTAELISGFIMIPFTSYGWMMVVGQLVNGLVCELPYACLRYRSYGLPMLLVGGAITGVLAVLSEYPLAGYAALEPAVQFGMIAVTAASCMIAAWLSKLLSDKLLKAGLLADYRRLHASR